MKLLVAAATGAALGLLTAGCSSGSGSAASSASTAATSAAGAAASSSAVAPLAAAAASSAAAPSAATGGRAGPIALCTTLPTAQAASLSGAALTSSREQDFAAGNSYTCAYFTSTGTGGISVTVTVVGGATAYANTLSTDTVAGAGENVLPLADLGDKAFSAHDGVHALFGDRLIYVAGLTSVAPAEAIVKAVQAKLT